MGYFEAKELTFNTFSEVVVVVKQVIERVSPNPAIRVFLEI